MSVKGIFSPQAMRNSNEIVDLNVGGHMYTTTRSTLARFPSSQALMGILQNCGSDRKVFIDRNGRLFEYILGFLRTEKLCLPDDFSDFASLTTEVEFYDIPQLSLCLEEAKESKSHVKYIEILETKTDRFPVIKTVLKGRKEDLQTLPLTAFQIEDRFEPEDSSYAEIILLNRNARLQLAEVLSKNGWTCESSDFSSTLYHPPNIPQFSIIEHWYRDRWKK